MDIEIGLRASTALPLVRDPDAGHEDAETLVRRAQRGDAEAFAALVRAHEREVRRVAASLIRDSDDAEDVAQEVWLRVAEKMGQLASPARFGSWLRSIARNVSLNFIRARRGPHPVDDADGTSTSEPADDTSVGPEQRLVRQDDERMVWETLGTMSEDDRVMLRLRELEDRSYVDIARIISTSSHAAEVRSSRARDRFRRRFRNVEVAPTVCAVNPLQLQALARGGTGSSTPLAAHVARCAVCQARLAAMRVGRLVFAGLSGLLLLPSDIARLVARLRQLAGGDARDQLQGVSIASRIGTAAPVAADAASASFGATGLAMATALSVAFGLGASATAAPVRSEAPVAVAVTAREAWPWVPQHVATAVVRDDVGAAPPEGSMGGTSDGDTTVAAARDAAPPPATPAQPSAASRAAATATLRRPSAVFAGTTAQTVEPRAESSDERATAARREGRDDARDEDPDAVRSGMERHEADRTERGRSPSVAPR